MQDIDWSATLSSDVLHAFPKRRSNLAHCPRRWLPPLLVELETFLAQYPADQETV
jgi:hypothetical protein